MTKEEGKSKEIALTLSQRDFATLMSALTDKEQTERQCAVMWFGRPNGYETGELYKRYADRVKMLKKRVSVAWNGAAYEPEEAETRETCLYCEEPVHAVGLCEFHWCAAEESIRRQLELDAQSRIGDKDK